MLAQSCDPQDWLDSSIKFEDETLTGCFADRRLVTAGALHQQGEQFLDIGIATHPGYRGRGFGRAVVAAMTRTGLAERPVMRYRTLQANAPSVAIAQSLGFELYASTLAIRLKQIYDKL